MRTTSRLLLAAAAAAVGAAACGEGATAPSAAEAALAEAALLTNAFASATPGYDRLSSSYDSAGQSGTWAPEGGRGRRGGRGHGGGDRGPGYGDFMGGGVGAAFLGGPLGGFGRRGPFGGGLADSSCTYAAGTGRVTCAPATRNGLTYARSGQYLNAAGAPQAAFDSLATNSVSVQTSVSGTTTFTPGRRHGFGHGFGRDSATAGVRIASATSTVQSASSRTVTGLASGSASRTVHGTSAGTESTTGVTTDSVRFTSARTMGDTTTGLVVPARTGTDPVYPTAGTVVREMRATVTFAGQSPVTNARREVLTYDGAATARLVITQNGATRNCTVALPRGRPSCGG